MSDIRCLEHPTLKVPYENLNKRFRSAQKTIDREVRPRVSVLDEEATCRMIAYQLSPFCLQMSHVNSALEALEKVVKDSGPVSEDQLPQLLVSLAEKVEKIVELCLHLGI